ncbi:VOC family protein [Saccharopolyspora dendranthemae]|uniref:Glyoxalase-like domain-containing protein n=1 Tax=Saccharopolyspora dendranthemae TaxID=1181886 RepID=A0A561U768_9PSEU|nr:VOC family protein [Saccharopolyspora dendranthemae]TWF95210.1 hypothetical protein FHU35_12204 [Saccharopolyspora dendranthemae]
MDVGIDLTLDCDDAAVLAEFWKTALGYVDEPPPPPFTSRAAWLAHHGNPEDSAEDGAWLRPRDGTGPRLAILKVPEPKTAKNRLHIDIRVPGHGTDAERWARVLAEADRLAAAGARLLVTAADHHVVMADPEDNEFCVAAASKS